MKKIKSFLFSEKKLSGAIFGIMAIVAFAFVFGPNLYAQFYLSDGGTGYGYGYGYGSGYGADDGSYRTGGDNLDQDSYGYGYAADTYTWNEGAYTACVGSVKTRTVTCRNSNNVVADDASCTGSGTKPEESTACNPGDNNNNSGGGGGGSYTVPCTSVVYGNFADSCFSGYQYRGIISSNPASCALTVAQQDAAKKVCGTVTVINDNGDGLELVIVPSGNTISVVAQAKAAFTKVNWALVNRLSGRILLQVQSHGEAWYVNPTDLLKYYMGRPADAFAMMREFGLGVSETDYNSFVKNGVPARLSGRILLRVQAHGEAYYISPTDGMMSYMGRPADAFALMRKFGLGITNADLNQIGVGELK